MVRFTLIPLVLAAGLASCSEGNSDGQRLVARPTAYPRLAVYDSIYTDCGLPAGFEVNAGATAVNVTPEDKKRESETIWIDIKYPAYGATLHCTFIPVEPTGEKRDQMLANRHERMMLNLGDNFGRQTELQSEAGAETLILTTTGQTLTPVQFLSASERWIVSGGLQFADGNVKADSIAPLINAVQRDIIHAARRLR